MINFYDIAYTFGLGASAPVWAVRSKTRKKVLDAFAQRMGQVVRPAGAEGAAEAGAEDGAAATNTAGLCVMLHAVSVGELNAAAGLVKSLREQYPGVRLVLSTTTDTGSERAQAVYGSAADVTLIRYPLDFSLAVGRVLDGLKPTLVILMELEVWPNFMAACERRGIPVMIANGRITDSSFRNFRIGSWLTRRMFRRLAAVGAQEQAYAERFITLGCKPEKTVVTGTMKFDTAPADDDAPGAAELAAEMGLRQPLWVAGSTGPGEEEIVLAAYAELLNEFPDLQLAVIPRKPERFDEVAALIESKGFACVRRSKRGLGDSGLGPGTDFPSAVSSPTTKPQRLSPILLGDTMGELRKFYAAAAVVFVGRTLVDLGEKQHGSDMIEPAALGKPTVVGPYTGNFTEVMNAFRAANAMIELPAGAPAAAATNLAAAVASLLKTPGELGSQAKTVVDTHRGATERTMSLLVPLLPAISAETNK